MKIKTTRGVGSLQLQTHTRKRKRGGGGEVENKKKAYENICVLGAFSPTLFHQGFDDTGNRELAQIRISLTRSHKYNRLAGYVCH